VPTANINYILGGYFQSDDIIDSSPHQLFDAYTTVPAGVDFGFRNAFKTKTYAGFANFDAEPLPGLTLTAGARYTNARQKLGGCTFGNATITNVLAYLSGVLRGVNGLPPAPASAFAPGQCFTLDNVGTNPTYLPTFVDLHRSESNVSWRGGVNYKVDRNILLYALASRGYKAGLYQINNNLFVSQYQPVKQEELTAYEAGVKFSLFDRVVNGSVSAFHYDYRDKQFFTFLNGGLVGALAGLVNIPHSKVNGIDAELNVRLARLELRGAMTYIDTKVDDFETLNGTLQTVDVTGNQFNFAPKWSATFGATYTVPISEKLKGSVAIDGLYNSATNSALTGDPDLAIPSYTTLDASVGLTENSGNWRASLWVRNLTNKFYWTSTGFFGDGSVRTVGRPRSYGASVGFKF
jgi:iron complex outermembrane recepter protein